ncbi:MAG: hypothetical protein LBQ69_00190 [Treponema sp.]|jgi:hypothetical protein|nr:hypothetical protein [Treponema sp.]
MKDTNSNCGIVLSVIVTIAVFMFFLSCSDVEYWQSIDKIGLLGYETNGILEGTVWVDGNTTLSFSRNAVTVSDEIYLGRERLKAGTYYSYFEDPWVYVDYDRKDYGLYHGLSDCRARLDGVTLGGFYPPPGTVYINGKVRFYNNFVAEETEGGLAITEYLGSLRNLVIPAEIGGVPIVAIAPFQGLQLATVIIPPSVTTIRPGVFRSGDLFGYSSPGRYLSGGITIGADVTIMGENAGAGWDQGWGALDPVKVGAGNFIAHEHEHLGYWLDMGFVKFYNENGRQAGKYTWTSSYDSYNYRYTFTWAFTPPPQQL